MNNYRFYYAWRKGKDWEAAQMAVVATGPAGAIGAFHRELQSHAKMADDRRTTIRPKLTPEDYRVDRMVQYYHNAHFHAEPWKQPIVESILDYPASPNPYIHKDLPVSEQPEFNFS